MAATKSPARKQNSGRQSLDVSALSFSALNQLIDKAVEARDAVREEEKVALKERIAKIVSDSGFEMSELFPTGTKRRAVARPKSASGETHVGTDGLNQYQRRRLGLTAPAGMTWTNPEDPTQVYKGRGARPAWLLDRIEKTGKNLVQLADK